MEEIKVSIVQKLHSLVELIKSFFIGISNPPQDIDYKGVTLYNNKVLLLATDKDDKKYVISSNDGVNFVKVKETKFFPDFFKPTHYLSWDDHKSKFTTPRANNFDHADITILNEFEIEQGTLVIYDASYKTYGHMMLKIGAVLFDHSHTHVIWRPHEEPIFEQFLSTTDLYTPLGCILKDDDLYFYYQQHPDNTVNNSEDAPSNNPIFVASVPQPYATLEPDFSKATLVKHDQNPIAGPHPENKWEQMAVFNPAAVSLDGKVHLFYRAHGHDGISVIGYASSSDGINFKRLNHPVFIPENKWEGVGVPKWKYNSQYRSGTNSIGSEDPRATIIDDRLYLIYASFNGWEQARLAMTSISLDDFRNQKWDWDKPQLITRRPTVFGTGNKCGALFPEKINNKYVLLHRYWPNICIDYVDDLDFGEGKKFAETKDIIPPRRAYWDSAKVGAGPSPILTEAGWLLIYNSVGYQDNNYYKIGAMLLDKDDPSKVLFRSKRPILNPAEWYENKGLKYGVVYACGAVVHNNELLVYYGGSDTYIAVASLELNSFLHRLQEDPYSLDQIDNVNVDIWESQKVKV